jgi:hypothetical protein
MRYSIPCFFALCIEKAAGLSVMRTVIAAYIFPASIASIIDWKFEPLPEARTAIFSSGIWTSPL